MLISVQEKVVHGSPRFLVKKPLGRNVFVKDLSMAKINMPMDDQV
jgi:hypothetical protein